MAGQRCFVFVLFWWDDRLVGMNVRCVASGGRVGGRVKDYKCTDAFSLSLSLFWRGRNQEKDKSVGDI